jgi:hypothetical protein
VTKSLGLDVDTDLVPRHLPSPVDGEVGGVLRRALAMFSEALYANTDTSRFIAIASLFEYLAYPEDYEKWRKVKKEIATHVARDKTHYHELSERFRELSGMKVNGVEAGIRTLLVHLGRDLIDEVPDQADRKKLFDELHVYCHRVIDYLLEDPSRSWSDVVVFREERRAELGVD